MTESFRRAWALLASDSDFQVTRGQMYLIFGMLDEAKLDIDAALAADPENAMGYYTLASIEEVRGHPSEAVQALQRAADLAEAQNQMQLTAMARVSDGHADATSAVANDLRHPGADVRTLVYGSLEHAHD